MAKWGLSGFLAGGVLSAVLFWALAGRRMAQEAEAARTAASTAAAAAAADLAAAEKAGADARAERDRAREEAGTFQKENEALKAEAAEANPGAGTVAGGNAGNRQPPPRRAWKDLAAEFNRLKDKLRGKTWDQWPPEAEQLKKDLFALFNDLARERGMSIEEILAMPGGMESLMLELLAQSVPPLDAATEAQLRDVLAAQEKAWAQFLESREDLTRLEQMQKFIELAGASRAEFVKALTPEQQALLKGFPVFDQDMQGSQSWVDGPRAKVTASITDQWSTSLGLDEGQTAALKPIVEEYITLQRDLNDSIWDRRRAGEDLSRQADYVMRLQLMIDTQKKINDTLRLTEDQQKALRDWQFTWGANVTDEMGAPEAK
ncbi:MAG: hypothetical protein HYY18_18040 [Planctomycetes bacterium]|nr:hypothetical protein [Planctomycetota bacterium]